jgi:hypothetical protein
MIAPQTATPTAEPSDRANMLVPVTAPRSVNAADDWAAMSVGTAVSPIPTPTTNVVAATAKTDDDAPSRSVSEVPARTSAEPMTAVQRKPIRS